MGNLRKAHEETQRRRPVCGEACRGPVPDHLTQACRAGTVSGTRPGRNDRSCPPDNRTRRVGSLPRTGAASIALGRKLLGRRQNSANSLQQPPALDRHAHDAVMAVNVLMEESLQLRLEMRGPPAPGPTRRRQPPANIVDRADAIAVAAAAACAPADRPLASRSAPARLVAGTAPAAEIACCRFAHDCSAARTPPRPARRG